MKHLASCKVNNTDATLTCLSRHSWYIETITVHEVRVFQKRRLSVKKILGWNSNHCRILPTFYTNQNIKCKVAAQEKSKKVTHKRGKIKYGKETPFGNF